MKKTTPINVTIWNEYRHERSNDAVAKIYPKGIHATLAECLSKQSDLNVRTATLDEPEHGLTDEVLENTDVMLWWGHHAHEEVSDEVVNKVYERVLAGMGLIVLHSAHYSKIFRKLMGTSCKLKWREADDVEKVWNLVPSHPILKGIGESFEIPQEEMYGEIFDIPEPDETLLLSWFTGGEVFRSGATWRRGRGRIFYLRPGHETFPTYHREDMQTIISNSVYWASNSC